MALNIVGCQFRFLEALGKADTIFVECVDLTPITPEKVNYEALTRVVNGLEAKIGELAR